MKKREVTYTDELIGNLKVLPDFLPGPEDLILTRVLDKKGLICPRTVVKHTVAKSGNSPV